MNIPEACNGHYIEEAHEYRLSYRHKQLVHIYIYTYIYIYIYMCVCVCVYICIYIYIYIYIHTHTHTHTFTHTFMYIRVHSCLSQPRELPRISKRHVSSCWLSPSYWNHVARHRKALAFGTVESMARRTSIYVWQHNSNAADAMPWCIGTDILPSMAPTCFYRRTEDDMNRCMRPARIEVNSPRVSQVTSIMVS